MNSISNRSRNEFVQKLLKIINMLLIAGIFDLAWLFFYRPNHVQVGRWAPVLLYFMYCFIYVMYTKIYDGFLVLSSRIYELICGQALSALIADLIMFIVIWLMTAHLPNILPLAGTFLLQVFVSYVWSVLVHRWYFRNHSAQRVLFVKSDDYDIQDLMAEYGFAKRYETVNIITPQELIASDFAMLDEVETVFICYPAGEERNAVISACSRKMKGIFVVPELADIVLHGAKQVHMLHSAVLRVSRSEHMFGYLFAKRCLDLFFSGAALILLSPIMLGVSIAIKLDDGGPIFYRQKRLTLNGKEFDILKFRSMRVDAEKDGIARLSTGDRDDRITRVGHFIRKTRFDELPQIINILKGDMTIVGPRPERPELTEEYQKVIPQFRQRLRVKAGLTGYAQVYGKYNSSPYNKLLMDMVYIEHRSMWEDLQIMFVTVKVIFMPDSTEGVAEGQTSALKAKQ